MFRASVLALLLISPLWPATAHQTPGNASPPQPGGPLLGRASPPQPLQRQSIEYFIGTWTFTWTGRESPLTPGPRTGTATYARLGTTSFLELRIDGVSDAGPYKETATLGWLEGPKVLAINERLSGGIEMLSLGDWSSAISIRFDSAPVRVQGQTLRLRRTYGIVSAQSFTVNEEIATGEGPFVRLGGGVFSKTAATK